MNWFVNKASELFPWWEWAVADEDTVLGAFLTDSILIKARRITDSGQKYGIVLQCGTLSFIEFVAQEMRRQSASLTIFLDTMLSQTVEIEEGMQYPLCWAEVHCGPGGTWPVGGQLEYRWRGSP